MNDSEEKKLSFSFKKCTYCKRTENLVPISMGNYRENICLDCKRDLVRQKEHCQKIVDEVIHNMECLFAEPWDKQIKIREYVRIKNFRWKIPAFVKNIWEKVEDFAFVKGIWGKLINVTWEASIEPDVLRIKIKRKKKICIFKIRMNTPAGIAIAEVAHAVIKDYLAPKANAGILDKKWIEGFSEWYMIHYLYNMDYETYADGYDQTIEGWEKEKNAIYKELKNKKNPKNREIMPLDWEIRQMLD